MSSGSDDQTADPFGQGAYSQSQYGQGPYGQTPFSQGQPQPGPGQPGPGQYGPGPGQFAQGQPGPGQYAPGPGQFGQGQFAQQPGWPPSPPYAQTGPYMQMGAGWPQLAARRTNPLAIAALCCSIGQVIAGPFAGIAAIVLGAISLKQIRLSGEDGRGLAITGLVLGIVGTIIFAVLILMIVAIAHGVATNSPPP